MSTKELTHDEWRILNLLELCGGGWDESCVSAEKEMVTVINSSEKVKFVLLVEAH